MADADGSCQPTATVMTPISIKSLAFSDSVAVESGYLPLPPDSADSYSGFCVRLSGRPSTDWIEFFDLTSSTIFARVAGDDILFALRSVDEAERALPELRERIRIANERWETARIRGELTERDYPDAAKLLEHVNAK